MTPEWLIWYGLRIGLSYDETLDIPFGTLLSLIAAERIGVEGWRYKRPQKTDEDIIPDLR